MVSVLFIKVKPFRVLRFDVFVIIPNFGQILVVIACGIENPLNAAIPLFIVDEAEDDGYMGTFSNDIEAFLPMLYSLSSAFRTNDEVRVLVLAEHVDHLFHEVVLVPSVDGDSADFLQEPADDGNKEFLLYHHLELDAVRPIEGQPDEEILDGRVRRNDANGVAQSFGRFVDGGPAAELEADFSYGFLDAHKSNEFPSLHAPRGGGEVDTYFI